MLKILQQINERIKDELLLFSVAIVILLTFISEDLTKYIVLAVYVVGATCFTFFRSKKQQKGKISVYVADFLQLYQGYKYLEVFNNGDEDIINFRSEIEWLQKDGVKSREMVFIKEGESALHSPGFTLNVLRKGEKVHSVNIPHYSIDGKIKVKIRGIGGYSNNNFEYFCEVKNEIKNEN